MGNDLKTLLDQTLRNRGGLVTVCVSQEYVPPWRVRWWDD